MKYTNKDVLRITGATSILEQVRKQQSKYIAHTIRQNNNQPTKIVTFENTKAGSGGQRMTLLNSVVKRAGREVEPGQFYRDCMMKKI